jgi:hypothetical protein
VLTGERPHERARELAADCRFESLERRRASVIDTGDCGAVVE